jgi:hypothetical protein
VQDLQSSTVGDGRAACPGHQHAIEETGVDVLVAEETRASR